MSVNTGGPAFPQHGWSKDPEVLRRMKDQGGMTLLDWYAGQALAAFVEANRRETHKQLTQGGYEYEETHFIKGFLDEDWWGGVAKASYACASAMLAEKARREATVKDCLPVQDHFPDATKMVSLESANRELAEALDTLTLVVGLTPLAGNKQGMQEAVDSARAVLSKHKGAA